MKDYLVQCRVGCFMYFIAAMVAIFYLNWPLAGFFFIISVVFQVGGFIIQEIRNARV